MNNKNKGKCLCGKETIRTIEFGENSKLFICGQCTEKLAKHLYELANEDWNERD